MKKINLFLLLLCFTFTGCNKDTSNKEANTYTTAQFTLSNGIMSEEDYVNKVAIMLVHHLKAQQSLNGIFEGTGTVKLGKDLLNKVIETKAFFDNSCAEIESFTDTSVPPIYADVHSAVKKLFENDLIAISCIDKLALSRTRADLDQFESALKETQHSFSQIIFEFDKLSRQDDINSRVSEILQPPQEQ